MPFTPFAAAETVFAPGRKARLTLAYQACRKTYPQRAALARIPIERFAGRLLLIAGDDDQMWPSAFMSRNIKVARDRARRRTELLIFPGAGHLVSGDGYAPIDYGDPFDLGGGLAVDARAQAIAWPRAISFLKAALRPAPMPPLPALKP